MFPIVDVFINSKIKMKTLCCVVLVLMCIQTVRTRTGTNNVSTISPSRERGDRHVYMFNIY